MLGLLTLAAQAVPRVAVPALAVVAARRVAAGGRLVTPVAARRALVHLGAVELVDAPVAVQALAHVRAGGIDAARVGMAVVALQPALGLALVHVWHT